MTPETRRFCKGKSNINVSRVAFVILINAASNTVLFWRQCNEAYQVIMVKKHMRIHTTDRNIKNNRVAYDLQQVVPKVTSLLLCRHCWLIQMQFLKVSLKHRQVVWLTKFKTRSGLDIFSIVNLLSLFLLQFRSISWSCK